MPSPTECSNTESSAENTESSSSSSEGGDDEDEDEGEEGEEREAVEPPGKEGSPWGSSEIGVKAQTVVPKNVRSVDILSKISLNDIAVQLYQFDPEEYAELRTNFGITSTVAYGKHTQTDCGLVSTASQTSAIAVRDRSTCMHEGFRALRSAQDEEDWPGRLAGDEDDDGEVQNYSSLQNIERMFCTLNGALERRFFKVNSPTRVGLLPAVHNERNQNQQRSISQLLPPYVRSKHKLNCWEMVAVKVLPVPVIRESSLEIGSENAFNQVFGLFSTGIIVVWNVQIQTHGGTDGTDDVLSAKLGPQKVTLVQSKVMDLNNRIGGRLPYDALRTFEHLLLHDHHQMVLSSRYAVIRLSHFVQSEYDPVLLIQPDPSHSIVNLKRMVQANDTLFVLYSNKTVRVLKLCTEPGGGESARNRHRKHDHQPHLMLSVCTNKSCTIQSIVHDEAKRYGNSNGSGEGRADGGTLISKEIQRVDLGDGEVCAKPRFHHGQQILFFDAQNPEGMLTDVSYREKRLV
uniref:Uncharacterized protein n=1 Tax=Anopheles epiroticus TaxID=199890 RepID=A0A182NZL1_9DIPT